MKIFLVIPFSSRVDNSGMVLPEYRSLIEPLINDLEKAGHEVYCALRYSNWKIAEADPAAEFRHDLNEIEAADEKVILLEERVSAGVQLEMGYAFAKGKKLHIYQIGESAWSNKAFSAATGEELIQVESIEEFVGKVREMYC